MKLIASLPVARHPQLIVAVHKAIASLERGQRAVFFDDSHTVDWYRSSAGQSMPQLKKWLELHGNLCHCP